MADHAFLDTLTYERIAKTIDHSLLKPELTVDEVVTGCQLALTYHVASVCVKPCDVTLAGSILAGTDVKVGTVVGFPHGSSKTATKVFESRQAIEDGAEELDMVINIGRMRSSEDDYIYRDIAAVVEVAESRALVKVILENSYLTDDEKVRACKLAEKAGAHFVKTSTGFAPYGSGGERHRSDARIGITHDPDQGCPRGTNAGCPPGDDATWGHPSWRNGNTVYSGGS